MIIQVGSKLPFFQIIREWVINQLQFVPQTLSSERPFFLDQGSKIQAIPCHSNNMNLDQTHTPESPNKDTPWIFFGEWNPKIIQVWMICRWKNDFLGFQKSRWFVGEPFAANFAGCTMSLGLFFPPRIPVPTRSPYQDYETFFGDPELNLHLPLLLGRGGNPKWANEGWL